MLTVILDDERLFTELQGPVVCLRREIDFVQFFNHEAIFNKVDAIFWDHDLGPDGGAGIKCARYFVNHLNWLKDCSLTGSITLVDEIKTFQMYVHSMNPVGGH